MSRFLLMVNWKTSDLFLRKLMFKCLTTIILGEFSFITCSPILASLNSSGADNKGEFRVESA